MAPVFDFSVYLGLFLSAFGAASLLPLQSEALLVGLLLGGAQPAAVLVVASVGNVLGSVLNAALGDELVQSLHFLMGLRLQAGLAELDTGRQVTGNVDPERLSSLERDLLKDALAVVKRFKALLHQRLRLDLL